MSNFTADSFAAHLTRAFSDVATQEARPRAVSDTDERGRPVLEFHLQNPHHPRHSVALTASIYKGSVSLCSLWFGQVEVTGALEPEAAVPAIREILEGNLVAVVRYKDPDAYEDRRVADTGPSVWLYQLPDDEGELAVMRQKLQTKAGFWGRLCAPGGGVFEVYDWSESEIFER